MGFKRLTTRFLLIVLALFLVAGAISTITLVIAINGIIERLGSSYALERAEVERSRIGNVLDTEATLARKLADSPSLVHWMLDPIDPSLRRAAFEELGSFRQAFQDRDWFVAVGSTLTYYNQPTTGALAVTTLSKENVADAWYFNAIAAPASYSFNLDYDRLIGKAEVWINCLVRSGGKVIGVAGTGIDITSIISELIHSDQPGVRTILIDAKGAITADRDRSFLERNARSGAYGKKITIFDLAESPAGRARLERLIDEARAGQPAIGRVDMRGRSALTVITPIPEIGWFALVTVDPSTAISFVNFLPLVALFVAALLGVLVAITLLMQRLVLRPLVSMTSSAKRIAAGDYGVVLPADRDDEIGGLASAFNEMTDKVRRYTESLESLVEQRTMELSQTNERLAVANRQVMESIRYAKLMQDDMMPPRDALAARLASHSLFRRQRDIVGGDFLFYREFDRGLLIGVVDCAGHGVPGALMTMMASSALELITARIPFEDPAAILDELDAVIRASLHQDRGQGVVQGGMDVGLCACLPGERRLVYAGAAMPLYILSREGSVATHTGRKKAIGLHRGRNPGAFRNQSFTTDGQAFFLVTDGFVDQAGGKKGRAYGTRRLAELLATCAREELDATRPSWEAEFDAYRGAQAQRDDVLALGFRL